VHSRGSPATRTTIPLGEFRAATDAVLVTDEDRRVVEANPCACSLTGLPHAELTRRPIDDFVPAAHRARFEERWAGLLATGWTQGRCHFQRPDGVSGPVAYVARANTPFTGFNLSVARRSSGPEAARGSSHTTSEPADAPVDHSHDESGDAVFAELWDTLRAVATDPALIDALEGGQRERDERSDVA
jgi:PAS domain S-box-containing protein